MCNRLCGIMSFVLQFAWAGEVFWCFCCMVRWWVCACLDRIGVFRWVLAGGLGVCLFVLLVVVLLGDDKTFARLCVC